jgi:hypothetical protein
MHSNDKKLLCGESIQYQAKSQGSNYFQPAKLLNWPKKPLFVFDSVPDPQALFGQPRTENPLQHLHNLYHKTIFSQDRHNFHAYSAMMMPKKSHFRGSEISTR